MAKILENKNIKINYSLKNNNDKINNQIEKENPIINSNKNNDNIIEKLNNIIKELKYKNEINDNEISKLKNELNEKDNIIKEEKNINIKLNQQIKNLQNQIDEKDNIIKSYNIELNEEIIKLNNIINDLKKEINIKDNQINEEKIKLEELNIKINSLTESNNNLKRVFEFIDNKEKEIYTLQSKIQIQLKEEEKLMNIIFITLDEAIHYPIICKNTQLFNSLEILLYEKYPEYKEYENFFFAHGNKINKFKTLDENNISNGDIITLSSSELK